MFGLCHLLRFVAFGAKLNFCVGCDECEAIAFDEFDRGHSFAGSSLRVIVSKRDTQVYFQHVCYFQQFSHLEGQALWSLPLWHLLRKGHCSCGTVVLNRW